jgi:hypothetical protein
MPSPDLVNADFPLFDGGLRLGDSASFANGKGQVFLRWIPTPRIVFDATVPTMLPDVEELEVRFALDRRRSKGRARVTGHSLDGTGTWVTTRIEGSFLVPVSVGSGRQLKAIEFVIPNFLSLTAPVSVTFDGWKVELVNGMSREDFRRLRREGGFALTTKGVLSRSSGGRFSAASAARVFDALLSFLAFVRGAWCRPSILTGLDTSGRAVWHEWAATRISPWEPRSAWFPLEGQDRALNLLEAWWTLWQDPYWREVLERTSYYYVDANRPIADLGLITSQAALETISRAVLVVERGLISAGSFDSPSFSAFRKLRLLLSEFGISAAVPASLPGLTAYATAARVDGPESITRLRNRLIHPIKTARIPMAGDATFEAWRLALWYTEAVLLHRLGYVGSVWSRVESGYLAFP